MLLQLAESHQKYALQVRRHLHQYPELSWEEEKTVQFLLDEIDRFNILPIYKVSVATKKGGIVIDLTLKGAENIQRCLMRADIDALPIHEENEIDCRSKIEGKMHACGHDFHTAMLLAALKAIVENHVPLKNNIRFVFQRAEEVSREKSGGQTLVEEGVCQNIDKVYGLHILSFLESGTFFLRENEQFANNTYIECSIACHGGHVMHPHIGTNAIDIQTDISTALRAFPKQFLAPTTIFTFAPTFSVAGFAPNIRPNQLKMAWAFRNFLSHKEKNSFLNELQKKIEHIVSAFHDAKVSSFKVFKGHPPLYNNTTETNRIRNTLIKNDLKTEESPLSFAGEDFSYYLEERPGFYGLLGAKTGAGQDHHTAQFNPDEKVLYKGIAYWLLLACHDH